MKGWSLKIKVTLVYTLFMTLLTCVSLGLLFSLSSQEILESVQKELEDRVYDSTEEISVKKEKLVPDGIFITWKMVFICPCTTWMEIFFLEESPMDFRKKQNFQKVKYRLWEKKKINGMSLM